MSGGLIKVLLVEDDDSICRQLLPALLDAGYNADVAGSLAEARSMLTSGWDLILLDLGLPDGDGLDLCRQVQKSEDSISTIVLTARNALEECVAGLEAGADDYVTKPFHLTELFARMQAVLRRSDGARSAECLSAGELKLDPRFRKVWLADKELDLKRREFDLLAFLLSHPGRTWTRAQLLARVWGPDYVGEDRTVDIHIRRLRALIEPDSQRPTWLKTVWGVGYRFEEDHHGN